MKSTLTHSAIIICSLTWGLAWGLACTTPGFAAAAEDNDKTTETIEVKRVEAKGPKHPTLQFLKDHRVFIRARLDELRTQTTRVHSGDAEMLDERYLRLQEMAAAIAAARDTVDAGYNATAARDTLSSVTQLVELEAQLDLMEQLLADQRRRLLMLEEDFLGHQETALVVLIKGLSGKSVPEAVVLTEENDIFRVELTPDQRRSLEQGGIAQIYHKYVEPREHRFDVSFAGGAWTGAEPVAVNVDAARDRITFLELDLGRLDHKAEAGGLLTSVWYR